MGYFGGIMFTCENAFTRDVYKHEPGFLFINTGAWSRIYSKHYANTAYDPFSSLTINKEI